MDKRQRTTKRPVSEYKESVLDLRRVTRVVSGGKRFRFRATVVVGNEKGKVGIGIAKGIDVQGAVNKAKEKAKKNIKLVKLEGTTIPHEVKAKYSAASVLLKPAEEGHGLKAGGAARTVLALAGVKDVTGKCLGGTANKLTNAMATLRALEEIKKEKPELRSGVTVQAEESLA